ncbi:MAG: alpha/beta hydrolase [Acidobacteriia bacterium]|nr:alpha/beta hydrolase [Terriglobia bacterium]
MTAIAALLAIIDGVWHWDGLVLFDPPVVPPEGNPRRGPLVSEGETLRAAALGRQNRFQDPEELADVFRWMHRFRRLRPGVAELNARSVLHFDRASGEWLLRCPGTVEADLYTDVAELEIWQQPNPAGRPLLIVGSDPVPEDAPKTAPCCKSFCETFGIEYAFVPDTSHLLQLEEPEQCFALFDAFLSDNEFAT